MFRNSRKQFIGVMLVIVFTMMSFGVVYAASTIPSNTFSYQGRILDKNTGAAVADASVNMIFRLYDAPTGGICLWSNNSSTCHLPAARSVTLTSGLFSENLGDQVVSSPHYAPIPDSVFLSHSAVYLAVTINGEDLGPDRKLITAAPFALNAHAIDGVDLINATGDVLLKNDQILNLGSTGQTQLSFDATSINAPGTEAHFTKLVLPDAGSQNIPMLLIGTAAGTATLAADAQIQAAAYNHIPDPIIILGSTSGIYNGTIGTQGPCVVIPFVEDCNGRSTTSGEFSFTTMTTGTGHNMDISLDAGGGNILLKGQNFQVNSSGDVQAVSITGIGDLTIASTNWGITAAGVPTFGANTSGNTLINDGSGYKSVALSGAITMNSAGVTAFSGPVVLGTGTSGYYVASVSGDSSTISTYGSGAGAAVTVGVMSNSLDFTQIKSDLPLHASTAIYDNILSLNASSNFATNINTGTSTGTVSIGNAFVGSHVGIAGGTVWGVNSSTGDFSTIGDVHADTSVTSNTIKATNSAFAVNLFNTTTTNSIYLGSQVDGLYGSVNIATSSDLLSTWNHLVNIAADNGVHNVVIGGGSYVLGDDPTAGTDGADRVSIATNGTHADTVNIGNLTSGTIVGIRGGTNWNIAGSTGDFSTIGNIATTGNIVLQNGAGMITSSGTDTATRALSIDSQLNGTIYIGASTVNSKTIIIGDPSHTTNINLDAGAGGITIGNTTATKEIDIGGVTASGVDTIKIATNNLAADTIEIGNNHFNTTTKITGGSQWSIANDGTFSTHGAINESYVPTSNSGGSTIAVTPGLYDDSGYAGGGHEYNAIGIGGFEARNYVGTDTVNGLSIGSLNQTLGSANLHIDATAVSIGSTWDTGIKLANTSSNLLSDAMTGIQIGDMVNSGSLNVNTGIKIGSGWDNAINIDSGALKLGSASIDSTTNSVSLFDNHSATGAVTVNIGAVTNPTDTSIVNIATGNSSATAQYVVIGSTFGASMTQIFASNYNISGSGHATFTLAHSGSDAVCFVPYAGSLPDSGGMQTLTDCSGGPTADYAEKYPVATGATYGDIVVPGTSMVTTKDGQHISQLVKSSAPYTGPVAGIISNNYGDFTSAGNNVNDSDNPMPVALVGRVPVNVTNENGAIAVGDYITTSSTAGFGMKATQAGRVIGMALEAFNGTSGQVMVQVNNSWYFGKLIGTDGTSSMFTDNVITAPIGTASSSTPTFDSFGLELRGSAWNGSAAQTVQMAMKEVVTDTNNYRLSVRNTTDSEVAYVTNTGTMQVSGDMVVGGKIYPSNNGAVQTSKYIYYDGAVGPAGDYMRTNAKGWSTGSYDFAEMFPASESLVPGEVVVFSDNKVEVRRSENTHEKVIAGIVSTRPGFLAGDNIANAYPIALAGRVPTNVNLEGGAIAVGDPLTTSSQAGFAMKAKKAGPIVGYALEPFNDSSGQITVFVNAGYWGGESTSSTPGANNSASLLGSNGNSSMAALNMSGNVNMNGNDITSIGRIAGLADAWSIESDGTIKTTALLKTVIVGQNNQKVETIGVTSPEAVITLAGTAKLVNGTVDIKFADASPDFANVISSTAAIRVIATPNGPVSLYVSEKDSTHFTVQSFGSGNSDADFDWMVTAYRKGFEPVVIVPAQASSSVTTAASGDTTHSSDTISTNAPSAVIVPPTATVSVPTVVADTTTQAASGDTTHSLNDSISLAVPASSTSSSTTIVDPVASPSTGTSDASVTP